MENGENQAFAGYDKKHELVNKSLRDGRPKIVRISYREEYSEGGMRKAPHNLLIVGLVHRPAATEGVAVGALLNSGSENPGDLTVQTLVHNLNLKPEPFKALGLEKEFACAYDAYNGGPEDVAPLDAGKALSKLIDPKNGDLALVCRESFKAPYLGAEPKLNPASGEIVTASFNGAMLPVYREVDLIQVKPGQVVKHQWVDPSQYYTGNPQFPKLVDQETAEIMAAVNG